MFHSLNSRIDPAAIARVAGLLSTSFRSDMVGTCLPVR